MQRIGCEKNIGTKMIIIIMCAIRSCLMLLASLIVWYTRPHPAGIGHEEGSAIK
jgi:hypothetical protein